MIKRALYSENEGDRKERNGTITVTELIDIILGGSKPHEKEDNKIYIVMKKNILEILMIAIVILVVTVLMGWILSIIIPESGKDIQGLTVYDLIKKK